MPGHNLASLAQALLAVEDGTPSQRLVDLLLDLAVDGEFIPGKGQAIRNRDVASVLFALLPSCPPPLLESLLDTCLTLVRATVANGSLCSRTCLVEILR